MYLIYRIEKIIDSITSCDLCINRNLKPYEEPCIFCQDEKGEMRNFKYAPDAFVTIGVELNNYIYDNFKEELEED